jgi:alkanesulfonate monooxygenase SsuD/methylene tetrahydromethanopterin reductase-like flavin-dependent oxidoreductase (luciferase family)
MEATQERLAAGAARAGRSLDDIEIWYYLACCVSEDGDRARQLARRNLVYLAQYPHYQKVYEREGLGEVTLRIAALVREKKMAEAEDLVTDEMLEAFTVAGTPAECREQLRRFDRYPGVPVLHMIPFRIDEAEVRESMRLAAGLLDGSS